VGRTAMREVCRRGVLVRETEVVQCLAGICYDPV
jgi:hypothetical protein